MDFQQLDGEINKGISKMLNLSPDLTDILTAELSFQNKLNLFSSLIHKLKDKQKFNTYKGYENEYIREFIKSLFKCEELRNKIIHSVFIIEKTPSNKSTIIRQKKSAKANKGLVVNKENIEICNLVNIYDFIICMSMEVQEFFI